VKDEKSSAKLEDDAKTETVEGEVTSKTKQ
jgi:hypothetical protein